MIFIALNALFSILACIFLTGAMLHFRKNNFFAEHSSIEYLIAKGKDSFRKRLFRIHFYDIAAASILVVFTVDRILEDWHPYYNALTAWTSFIFHFLFALRCFKVWMLYRT